MMKRIASMVVLLMIVIQLAACGGVHDASSIHAQNEITDEYVSIKLKVHNTPDSPNFTIFTSPLDEGEMAEELRKKKNVVSVTDLGNHYWQLKTDSGEFFLKYDGAEDDEYRYAFFAEVGKASYFGEYVYIPFHMLKDYYNADCPAAATPFESMVFYDNDKFDLSDFAAYYEDKGFYTVERVDDTTLRITDTTKDYPFYVTAADHGEYGIFSMHDDIEVFYD